MVEKPFNWETATDQEVIDEVRRIRTLYKLKHVIRYGSTRDESIHAESVAEHIYGMQVLANYFLAVEPNVASLDKSQIMDLILYHEMGEIETGDIITYHKTEHDQEVERQAAQRVLAQMPEALLKVATAAFEEYERQQTPESTFVKALDKLEPVFELFTTQGIETIQRLRVGYEAHWRHKEVAVQEYPVMRRFLAVTTSFLDSQGAFLHSDPVSDVVGTSH